MSRTLIICGVAIWLVMTLLSGAAIYYHGQYSVQLGVNEDLQRNNVQQASLIATQSFQFNRFNQIALAAGKYAMTIGGKAQEKEIEYRNIIKTEPTCALAVPDDIAGRLLDYANRLRASAMHADPGIADSSGSRTAPASTLNYCQAVLWIDPLLTAIDQANSQLAGIRNIEHTRQGK
ncbi:hypothetical protein ACP3TC_07565 [Winslowiella sp. 2C04]|uniref:hypothetical protein n=1 Tax=Winslowiella sp. 2C04 TaxID=3416179 RepID=UPI003CE7FDAB